MDGPLSSANIMPFQCFPKKTAVNISTLVTKYGYLS